MKKILATVAVISLFMAGAAYGGDKDSKNGEDAVINVVCPVMGNAVSKDTSYKVEYQGHTIGFCCPACIEKFNAEPEKYMAKLELTKKCLIKCPKCGTEIDVTEECKKVGASCSLVGKTSAAEDSKKSHEGHKH